MLNSTQIDKSDERAGFKPVGFVLATSSPKP